MSFNKISESLNIEPEDNEEIIDIPSETTCEGMVPIEDAKDDIDEDYELSRETYKTMIEKGEDAISKLAKIADESDHPRAFEVLGQLIKTVSETADKLLILQKNKRELKKEIPGNGLVPMGGTTNNLFVGSTAELQKILEENGNVKRQLPTEPTPEEGGGKV